MFFKVSWTSISQEVHQCSLRIPGDEEKMGVRTPSDVRAMPGQPIISSRRFVSEVR